MKLIFTPERIDIVVSVDADTRALIDRALALVEGKQDKEIAELTAQLKASNAAMAAAREAYPDPDLTE
jgi:hypothetical protein